MSFALRFRLASFLNALTKVLVLVSAASKIVASGNYLVSWVDFGIMPYAAALMSSINSSASS